MESLIIRLFVSVTLPIVCVWTSNFLDKSTNSYNADSSKVTTIKDWHSPNKSSSVRSFLSKSNLAPNPEDENKRDYS